MKINLIRNATMKFFYGGKVILADPMLSKKGMIRSFLGKEKNPTVEMLIKIEDVMLEVDGVMISHTHPDHFDEAARESIPKDMKMFYQPYDRDKFTEFTNTVSVDKDVMWDKIKITRTKAMHGRGEALKRMGEASGFVLEAEGEPVVYWVGDSVLYEEIEGNIKKFNPDIIITHSGGAGFPDLGLIIMDDEETIKICQMAPNSKVIAVHLESLDHCPVTREGLAKLAEEKNISNLKIPKDGETIIF